MPLVFMLRLLTLSFRCVGQLVRRVLRGAVARIGSISRPPWLVSTCPWLGLAGVRLPSPVGWNPWPILGSARCGWYLADRRGLCLGGCLVGWPRRGNRGAAADARLSATACHWRGGGVGAGPAARGAGGAGGRCRPAGAGGDADRPGVERRSAGRGAGRVV